MFRVLPSAPVPAYPVPWQVERVSDTHPLLTNAGAEPVESVRAFGSHGTLARLGTLLPGESVDLCLCANDLDVEVVTVCWFRPATEVEYVWRFVM